MEDVATAAVGIDRRYTPLFPDGTCGRVCGRSRCAWRDKCSKDNWIAVSGRTRISGGRSVRLSGWTRCCNYRMETFARASAQRRMVERTCRDRIDVEEDSSPTTTTSNSSASVRRTRSILTRLEHKQKHDSPVNECCSYCRKSLRNEHRLWLEGNFFYEFWGGAGVKPSSVVDLRSCVHRSTRIFQWRKSRDEIKKRVVVHRVVVIINLFFFFFLFIESTKLVNETKHDKRKG